jgi:lipoprotein-anchoring transpeptidase ErfK/SrfK
VHAGIEYRSGTLQPVRKVFVVVAALVVLAGGCGASGHAISAPPVTTTTTVAPTTSTTIAVTAPPNESLVASPISSPLHYSATPGGPPIGTLPTVTWGNPTVRPVLSQTYGWVQIGLDTRPNMSTGWVPESSVILAVTAYRIVVSISQRSLTLYRDGQVVYTSPVGVGEPQWQTPLGTAFVDAVVATPKNQVYIYGPTVIILGLHSNVFTTFDGGDGTVAIHGYPSDPASTEGVAASHGCIRANPQTINAIDTVPLGSPVVVVA